MNPSRRNSSTKASYNRWSIPNVFSTKNLQFINLHTDTKTYEENYKFKKMVKLPPQHINWG